jgi:radical SAM superfamily enzyme YgiQ (UPF0313 family)
VADELEWMGREHGIQEAEILDPFLPAQRDRLLGLCERLEGRPQRPAWICQVYPELLTRDVVTRLKAAGCIRVNLSLESLSPRVLELNGRAPLEAMRQAIALVHDAGLQTLGRFVVGLPGDSRRTVHETIENALKLELDHAHFAAGSTLPTSEWHGLYLGEQALEQWRALTLTDLRTRHLLRPGTSLTEQEAVQLAREGNLRFYYRPRYLARALFRLRTPQELRSTVVSAWQLLSSSQT